MLELTLQPRTWHQRFNQAVNFFFVIRGSSTIIHRMSFRSGSGYDSGMKNYCRALLLGVLARYHEESIDCESGILVKRRLEPILEYYFLVLLTSS